ncbi:polyketide cyclase [Actinoalloteichus sp. AHMU CJ021]|uniref:Conserved protein YndB, AHSA1/START domain n=2 Tax=Actinoalloteichus cyanogriseus TaxID=2893586 RepID=A0ABT1JEH0_ACTCY|nr:SRPBCC domain-containing protein [Actinoalloteichus caeruleus]AUS81241.1 polyketide cyclase [Actinoalloteichus sp. AHMU CJ021]MCP2330890.1 putative conserved protein YndB, AHSA1/START domain [Actinoalloteichus caeruleus DSM 43889]
MDLLDHINRTHRAVKRGTEMNSVILTRAYDTTLPDLWDACVNPERLPRWFEPVSGDLREGGRYRLEGRGIEGTIEVCVPRERLRVTWEDSGAGSFVEVSLREEGDQAVLRVEHVQAGGDFWNTFGPSATGVGWDGSVLSLALHLAGDPRATPEEMAKVGASEEGVEFMRRTAAAWADADVEAGADPDHARQTSDRTFAFYTGAEQ